MSRNQEDKISYSIIFAHPISQALFDRMSDGSMNLSNLWK